MRKILILVLLVVFLLNLVEVSYAQSEIIIKVQNPLNVPVSKTVFFEVDKSIFNGQTGFQLLDNNDKLPLTFTENKDKITFKTFVSFNPNETKDLKLVYGVEKPSYTNLFIPDFLGTHFVVPIPSSVYIVSYDKENSIKIIDTKSKKEVTSFSLNLLEHKIVKLQNNSVYEIISQKPIFVSISTLTPPFDKNSSDDISSVFGTFFKLYVPKCLFITSSYDTHIKITDSNNNIVIDRDLSAKSYYANENLKEGFYTISSTKPVLIEYGYAEDNVFSFLYGLDNANVITFGGIGVSSIFPNTAISVQLKNNTENFKLENVNDFKYIETISKDDLSKGVTFSFAKVSSSQPVLIYTYSQYGNVDGEQIPGFSNLTRYSFRTGKVTNIYGERKRRVFVIPVDGVTQIDVNGKNFSVNPFEVKEFLFNESYSKVNITSDRKVLVFDLGIDNNKEIFTTLLPFDGANFLNVSVLPTTPSSNQTQNSGSSENPSTQGSNQSFFTKIKEVFMGIGQKIADFFKNINFNGFIGIISNYFRTASLKVLEFLRPASESIYNLVKDYIPWVTVDLISSIIFILFILILIILLIPKRREKKVPVVPAEEIKKKPIVFDVKDIEIKEVEKPTEEIKEIPEIPKIPVGKEETIPTIPLKKEEKPEEKTEEKEGRILRPIPQRRVTESLKPIRKVEEVKAPQEKPVETTPTKIEGTEREIIKPIEKPEEASSSKIVEAPKEAHTEKPIETPPTEVVETPQETVTEKPVETPSENIIEIPPKIPSEKIVEKETEKIGEPVKEEPIPREAQPETAQKEEKEEVEHESSFVDFAQPSESLVNIEGEKEEVKEEPKIEAKESEQKREFKSTFEELLEKLEREKLEKQKELRDEKKTIEELSKPEEQTKPQETAQPTNVKVEIKERFVIDALSVKKIYENQNLSSSDKANILNKACIVASQKSEVNDIIEGRYRVTVIALSPIEERLAEDVAKRLGASYTTGEAVLVAKKIRLNQVVVDDKPKLRNYQGVNIYSVDEVI